MIIRPTAALVVAIVTADGITAQQQKPAVEYVDTSAIALGPLGFMQARAVLADTSGIAYAIFPAGSKQTSHHHDQERHAERLLPCERRDPPHRATDRGRAQAAADEAFDRFRRAHLRRELVLAEEFAEHVLQHVAQLHDQ